MMEYTPLRAAGWVWPRRLNVGKIDATGPRGFSRNFGGMNSRTSARYQLVMPSICSQFVHDVRCHTSCSTLPFAQVVKLK